MPVSNKVVISWFIELTRIVRTSVILDHMYEWMEDTVQLDSRLWSMWQEYCERNESHFEDLLLAMDQAIPVVNAEGRDASSPDGLGYGPPTQTVGE